MNIILKQDVQNLGFKDDVVAVKNGYGRNYLLPQGMAVLATPSEVKQLEETLRQRAHREKAIVEEAQKTAEALKALELKLSAKVGAGIKLFGSVTAMDIAEQLKENDIEIDRRKIELPEAIKNTGDFKALVKVQIGIVAEIKVVVVGDQEDVVEAADDVAAAEAVESDAPVEPTDNAEA